MTGPNRNLRVFLALLLALGVCRSGVAQESDPAGGPVPRRVVLFIADGTGVAHWSAALFAGDSLAIQWLRVIGLVDTRNTSRPLPESASSASAIATGVTTYYHAISVGPDSLPRTTVLELAEEAGLATGLVTTALITDATPAAFAAHVKERAERYEIARQMAGHDIEVLMGDDRAAFDPATRPDSLDLLSQLRQGRAWIEAPEDLAALAAADSVVGLIGFFPTDQDFDTAARRPTLAAMTDAALRVLDRDPDGFFLMVENEHPDHFSHQNFPLARIIGEVEVLDRAIGIALEYQLRHPSTLVVVIGDHETGGLSLLPDESGALQASWSTRNHSAELVPVFALGPGAERFGGFQTGADIGRALAAIVTGDPRSGSADD